MRDKASLSGIIEPRSVFVKRLLAIVVVTNLFIIGLAGFSLQQARLQYEERTEITTQNLSHALAGYITDAVDKIDLTVLTVADEVQKQLAGGGIDEQKLNAFIVRHHARLPVLDGLRVVNAQGENAYGIGITPGARTSVADRAYFARLRDDPNAGVVISEPVVGRVSKKWSIILARRVNQPDGSFAGLVYGTIALEHFFTTFSSLDVGKHGSIALRDEELALIVRYPEPQEVSKVVGKKNASAEMQNAVQARKDAGSYRTALAFDNIPRTYSYHKASHYPLYVNVGLAQEDYLGAWWSEVAWVSALVALFILGTLLSSWLVYRGWMRRVNAVQALARQEEAMRESEESYRNQFQGNSAVMLLINPADGTIQDANAAALSFYGYTRERLLAMRITDINTLPASDVQQAMALFPQKEGERFQSQHRLGDGSVRDVEVSAASIQVGGRTVLHTIINDITERKRVEDLYRTLSDKSMAGVYVVQDGVFKYLNSNAISCLGYSSEELIGRPASNWVHPEDKDITRVHSREMLKGLRQTPYEFRIVDKTGSVRWVLESVTSIPYEGKQAILGHTMDISQLKEAQQKLGEMQALESSILAAIPHAVLGLENRRIIFANEGVENVFGWTREELIGKNMRILFRSDEAYEDAGFTVYTTPEKKNMASREYEAHFRHKDGRNLICRVTTSRIEGTLIDKRTISTIEDVTDLRNIQMQLLQSEKMSSIGQLAAGVAHEINNPTGYVGSNLETLKEYFHSIDSILSKYESLLCGVRENLQGRMSPESLSDQADAIESSKREIELSFILNDVPNLIKESRQGTDRIKNIVIDLKNFAHPGRAEFEYADIKKNIESTLNVIWNELKYKATIHKDYSELPPIRCIPQQLTQVFMNILVNASHAIKDKGEITIKTRQQNGHVEITIHDTGCGIPKENLSRIFDPFFTTKEVGKGTGLGLNVAYNIVKKHNGTIDVESQVGHGTTFIIKLPVEQSIQS